MEFDFLLANIGEINEKDFRVCYNEGDGFGDVLTKYMDERKISVEELSDLTGISVSTIIRYKNNTVLPSLRSLAAVSSAMHLHINRVDCMMKLCGYRFNGSAEHSLIYALLCMSYCSDMTVEKFNAILKEFGYKELTKM